MGFEAYDIAEEKYQADLVRLNAVADHVYNNDRGGFLTAMAEAWLLADEWNKRILWLAWVSIVVKYGLKAEVES